MRFHLTGNARTGDACCNGHIPAGGLQPDRICSRERALIQVLFALLGALAGAIIGAPLLAMAGAQVLTWIYGRFEGSAAMGGATIGAVVGLLLGIAVSLWLVLRKEGKWAGTAVAWLWVGALFMIGCLGFVAFS